MKKKNNYENCRTAYIIILQFLLLYSIIEIVNNMIGHALLVSVWIMALFAAATTITTIGMTNTTGNGIGMLLVEAQQQQNANVVTIGNCVTIGDNATLASSVTIGDNATIAENVRIAENTRIGENVTIAENTRIGENITMTSGGQMDGNASSPITSPQNATAVPVNTQINISC
jgi:UDP-3-O-[3-hydroxymyristoyl] glucosamine N-acyltransferase